MELESEKIYPKEFRIITGDTPSYIKRLYKALETAELEITKLQFKYNEVRKMADEKVEELNNQINESYNDGYQDAWNTVINYKDFNGIAKDRYEKALISFTGNEEFKTIQEYENWLIGLNVFDTSDVIKALKIAAYGKDN